MHVRHVLINHVLDPVKQNWNLKLSDTQKNTDETSLALLTSEALTSEEMEPLFAKIQKRSII